MMKRVSFSDENLELEEIWNWFDSNKLGLDLLKRDLLEAIRNNSTVPEKFIGFSIADIEAHIKSQLMELENVTSLSLLSAVEAKLRRDYLSRVYERKRDQISRSMKQIYNKKVHKVSLEEDILECWKGAYPALKRILGEYRGAMKYRNWLAHGRYWLPKFGEKYDLFTVYTISNNVVKSLDLVG